MGGGEARHDAMVAVSECDKPAAVFGLRCALLKHGACDSVRLPVTELVRTWTIGLYIEMAGELAFLTCLSDLAKPALSIPDVRARRR